VKEIEYTVIHPIKGDILYYFRNVQSASDGKLDVPLELNDITDFGVVGYWNENEELILKTAPDVG
jgi:hypothetical protein